VIAKLALAAALSVPVAYCGGDPAPKPPVSSNQGWVRSQHISRTLAGDSYVVQYIDSGSGRVRTRGQLDPNVYNECLKIRQSAGRAWWMSHRCWRR
jgi:hypothetical protein